MVAPLLRVLIVCAFAGALAVHVHRRSHGEAIAATLRFDASQHRTVRYLVLRAPSDPSAAPAPGAGARGRALGSLTWSCHAAEHGGEEEVLQLRLRDLLAIPAVAATARLLPQALPPSLEVALTVVSSHRFAEALTGFTASASAGGVSMGRAQATLDPGRTSVSWSWPSGVGAREFPPMPALQTLAVVCLLPAHLHPGMRAAITLPAVDAAAWTPSVRTDVLEAEELEEAGTIRGLQPLLRVEELSGTHRIARFWCDDAGLVWRASWDDLGLALELTTIEPGGP